MNYDQNLKARHAPSLTTLFGSFLRLGITAFGGPAMIAYIRRRAVTQNQWLNGKSFQDDAFGSLLGHARPARRNISLQRSSGRHCGCCGQCHRIFWKNIPQEPAERAGFRHSSRAVLLHGLSGAIVATTAIFLPSFLILIGIAPYFDRLSASSWFARAIDGILCSFVGLLLTVTIRFACNVHWDLPHMALAGAAFAALILKLDILWVVLAGTAVSMLVL
jgi:chromate transport protein ChrA